MVFLGHTLAFFYITHRGSHWKLSYCQYRVSGPWNLFFPSVPLTRSKRLHVKIVTIRSRVLCLHKKTKYSISCMVLPTEDTQSGNSHFLAAVAYIPSFGKIFSPVWWGWRHAHLLYLYIYYHEQSCGVCSSWECRNIPPISPLPLYVLCGRTAS